MLRIRDWDSNFERDRTRQWKRLDWVPIPNKQGSGYRRIMNQKDGPEIFGCWIAIVELASTSTPRGDLSKYSINDLSLLTLISEACLRKSIKYLSEVLDWIDVEENLDVGVKISSKTVGGTSRERSILFSSIQSNSIQSDSEPSLFNQIKELWYRVYEEIKGVKPAWISKGMGNYPKMIQALAELGRPIDEYEKAMRNGFSDSWHGQRMDLKYLLDNFNILLTYEPPKPRQQFGRQEVSNEDLMKQAKAFMERRANDA